MIKVSISTIVAGSLAICALSTCDSNDKDAYSRYGLDNPKNPKNVVELAADYQAEIENLERSLAYKSKELTRLKDELKALKSKQNEAGRDDNKQEGAGKTFEATFYTAFCPTGCTGVTATGVDVSNTIYHEGKRIIAVDPSVIPLGSHVKVTLEDGTSFEATAQDVGGAIKGNRIDILVASRDEAYRLGRQTVKVEILK